MRQLALIAALVFLSDQASKYIVVHVMELDLRQTIEVWPPYLTFHMAWNTGINFGLMSGSPDYMRWVLIAVSLAIALWVFLWIRRDGHGLLVNASAGLLIGGALGNVIDRIVYGAVADFLNMSCCGIENPYSFNIADIAIFAGAIGLVLLTGRDRSA